VSEDVARIVEMQAKGRIRPALADAIRLIVTEGMSQADAAKSVGYQATSLQIALKKPHVKAYVTAVKRAWLDSRTSKAWVNIADLADNAGSEDVRLKANKVFLEASGELTPPDGDNGKTARTLINIVLQNTRENEQPINARLPGVIEAPAYKVLRPSRPTIDQLDGDETEGEP